MKPPGIADTWDHCNVLSQAELIAYSHVREMEDSKQMVAMMSAMIPRI